MSDTYQAIYDATYAKLRNADVGAAIQAAAHLDASHAIAMIQQDFCIAACEMQRPSVLYRPSIARDGNQWSVLYGDNLMNGVCGYGDTPAAAMADFDKNWREQKVVVHG